MPYKPAKPCKWPGCRALTHDRYCEVHSKQEAKRYERYDRDPQSKNRYGRTWQKIREQYARSHPFCEECYSKGILVEVEEVHHIKPLREGGTNAVSNLRSLCKSCHLKAHGERGKGIVYGYQNEPTNR